ncbi:hypothetical protein D3C72_1843510 [compost metagenome]
MRDRASGSPDPAIVEGDDPALCGDAVDNTRVPVVEHGHQVVQEDHRHAGIRAKLPVGESYSANGYRAGRYILPFHIAHRSPRGGGSADA